MKKAVYQRGKDDPYGSKKRYTAVYAVECGEDFGIIGGEVGYGPHSGKDHGGVIETIYPA